ncbi:beta-ketoacyl synthase [Helicosporidium sp. ATCC 50920]|nr:beta-ketoacyl synthase [Helicosporidium sp. ATCC 50920]|eukprot:KDD76429.1 beta-ketoacyl synthase [Helicosporidium sp. ATCC 50920]
MSGTVDLCGVGISLGSGRPPRPSPYLVPRILPNAAAGAVSMDHGFRGPCLTPSTACAAGAHAIADAALAVAGGEAEVMVVGGAEACVDAVALLSFSKLRALSGRPDSRASRPFDAHRDGFVLGEGAGVLVLESLDHALDRKAAVLGEVRGWGRAGDAHHVTQPDPDGSGAKAAMRSALRCAGLSPEDIAYLNAHATGTPLGDTIEQRAIDEVFGGAGAPSLAVSSTKGATGHLLGAAGAVEAIFALLALRDRVAPPTCNLERLEPEVLKSVVGPSARALPARAAAAMTNSFGFGGVNVSLVLGMV